MLPDDRLVPFPESRPETDPLDEYITGSITAQQFARITGLTDIKPFLGCVIHRKEGPFVHQARHLLNDLKSVANFWNDHKGMALKPVERLPDDANEISALLDHMMECRHGDTAAVDQYVAINYLESLEPQQRETLSPNAG